MNNIFNNLVIFNGYPFSVIIAVTFHSFILVVLIWLQSSATTERLELIQPTIIKALFIEENPQTLNRQAAERRAVDDTQRELQQQQERQRQLEAEQREQAEELERAALRKREELEAQRQLERAREREQEQTQLEQRMQRDLAEAEQRRLAEEAENQRRDAARAEGARTELELIQSATAIIQLAVQQVWNRPPSARNGMRAILQIRMLPTGELLDARITESSGDPAFDRSAENAAFSAAPFIELRNLPINIFNSNFRTLSLIFQPEDLLN
jgi:colicin import membrane protein